MKQSKYPPAAASIRKYGISPTRPLRSCNRISKYRPLLLIIRSGTPGADVKNECKISIRGYSHEKKKRSVFPAVRSDSDD